MAGEPAFTPGPAKPQPMNFGHHAPSFDVIDLMPPVAAERFRMLRQRRADGYALTVEFERVREASMARVEAANALKRLVDHPQEGGFKLPPDDRRVLVAQRTLDKATDEFERLKQKCERLRFKRHPAHSLRVGRPGNTTLEAVETEPPKPLKGETVIDAVERVRRHGRELKADLRRIRSAPFPSSHCKSQMRAQIEQLAERGAPDVTLLIEHDGMIGFQTQQIQSKVYNAEPGAIAFAEQADTVALFA